MPVARVVIGAPPAGRAPALRSRARAPRRGRRGGRAGGLRHARRGRRRARRRRRRRAGRRVCLPPPRPLRAATIAPRHIRPPPPRSRARRPCARGACTSASSSASHGGALGERAARGVGEVLAEVLRGEVREGAETDVDAGDPRVRALGAAEPLDLARRRPASARARASRLLEQLRHDAARLDGRHRRGELLPGARTPRPRSRRRARRSGSRPSARASSIDLADAERVRRAAEDASRGRARRSRRSGAPSRARRPTRPRPRAARGRLPPSASISRIGSCSHDDDLDARARVRERARRPRAPTPSSPRKALPTPRTTVLTPAPRSGRGSASRTRCTGRSCGSSARRPRAARRRRAGRSARRPRAGRPRSRAGSGTSAGRSSRPGSCRRRRAGSGGRAGPRGASLTP